MKNQFKEGDIVRYKGDRSIQEKTWIRKGDELEIVGKGAFDDEYMVRTKVIADIKSYDLELVERASDEK